MTAPASTATVQAVLDFAGLDEQFAKKLQASTEKAQRVVTQNLSGVTKAAQSTTADVNKAFDKIALNIDTKAFSSGMATAEKSAKSAADTVEQGMERSEKSTGGAKEAAAGLGGTFKDLVTKAGTAAVGLLGVSTAVEGISQAIERSQISNKIGAQLGLTQAQSAQAGQIAGRVYAQNYGESFDATSEATGAVVSSLADLGDRGGASVEDLTKRVLTFGSTFGVEAGEVTAAANNMIQQGLVTSPQQALDLLASSFQRVPSQMRDEIFELINEYGTYFHSLGFDGQSAMGLIVNAAQNGKIAMDKVGDAVKEFGIRATDLGDTGAQQALQALGLNAGQTANELLAGGASAQTAFGRVVNALLAVKDPGKQAADAVALFGTPLEDLDKGKIPGFLAGLSSAGESMDGFGGTIDRMGAQLQAGPTAKLETLKRSIQGTLVDDLGAAATVVERNGQVFKDLGIAIGVAVAAYGVLRAAALAGAVAQGIQAAAAGAGTAAFSANTIAMGAYTVATTVMRIGTLAGAVATGVATAATWALNAALAVLTSPITLVIAAIAAFVAGIVLLYQHNQTFRDIVQGAWQAIQQVVQVAWQVIQVVFQAIVGWITGSLIPTLQNFWQFTTQAFNAIGAIVQYAYTVFISPILHDLALIFTAVIIPAIMLFWHGVMEPAFNAIGALISFWWQNIVTPAFNAVKVAIGLVGDAFSWWWNNIVTPVFNGAKAVISGWWDGVTIIFDKVKSGISLVGDAFSAAGRVMSGIWDGVVGAMRPAVHAIGSVLASIPTSIGPIQIPGAQAAKDLGGTLQRFAGGGRVTGAGTGTSDSILAAVSHGEFINNATSTGRWLPLLQAANDGADAATLMRILLGGALPAFAGGGLVNTRQLEDFARGIEGVGYVWGGWGNGWATDCSGAASALANYVTHQTGAGQGQRSGTGGMAGFLQGLGAQSGLGPKGSLNFGWYNGGPYGGHIAMTLPTGEHVEMGGTRGDGQFGGPDGAEASEFTQHAHFPPEFFLGGDLGGALSPGGGAGAALSASGTGGASGGALGTSSGGTSSGGGTGGGGAAAGTGTAVYVTNWPGGLTTTAGTAGTPAATTPGAATPATPTTTDPTQGGGIAAANAWAAKQDFGKQAQDWAVAGIKEVIGQFTDPIGLKPVSDLGVDQVKTAADALALARAQPQPVVGVMNVNGTQDPVATANAVVTSLLDRMAPVLGRYRNGG